MPGRTIATKDRLVAIHEASEGLVLNTDGKKLHAAGCGWVAEMGLATRKVYFSTWCDAKRELDGTYGPEGSAWIRCPVCSADPVYEDGGTDSGESGPPSPFTPPARIGAALARRARWPRPRTGVHPVLHEFAEERDGVAGVYLWCSEYIDFDYPPRPQDLENVAQELRSRLRALAPDDDRLLHAVYAGPKGYETDLENNLFYNIHTGLDTLRAATQGVKFEWWPDPPSDVLRGYGCTYAYRLVTRREPFAHWRRARILANWPYVSLGLLNRSKRVEPVWHALRTSELVDPHWPAKQLREPFGLSLNLLAPGKRRSLSAEFLKNVLDGVVSAFQHDPTLRRRVRVRAGLPRSSARKRQWSVRPR
jgi:hypothetical protein